jgi:primosomal protein N'
MGVVRHLFIEGRGFDPRKKCEFCGKRLKSKSWFLVGKQLLPVCHHCGREQSWLKSS